MGDQEGGKGHRCFLRQSWFVLGNKDFKFMSRGTISKWQGEFLFLKREKFPSHIGMVPLKRKFKHYFQAHASIAI